MNHATNFATILEQDVDLLALRERHSSVSATILETTARLLALENQIELARTADNVRAMADAIVSGQDIASADAAFYPPDCPSLPLSLTTVTRVAAHPEAADHLLPF